MNVVNFAEGILGIDKESAPIVAKCLRQIADSEIPEQPETPFSLTSMATVANQIESGNRADLELIRNIGEKRLADTQRLFLSL